MSFQDDGPAASDATLRVKVPHDPLFQHRSMRAYTLRQVEGVGSPREFPLSADYVVGRSQDADLQIDSPELSRQHFSLIRANKEYVATDLNSRNGLYLNGVKIHSASLRGGDALQIGSVIFFFIEGF